MGGHPDPFRLRGFPMRRLLIVPLVLAALALGASRAKACDYGVQAVVAHYAAPVQQVVVQRQVLAVQAYYAPAVQQVVVQKQVQPVFVQQRVVVREQAVKFSASRRSRTVIRIRSR